MVEQALILAGGLGTRLRSIVAEVPKPMAEIGGKPFLSYVFRYISDQGIRRCVIAVGYRKEMIKSYWGSKYGELELVYSEEERPLGTGGAVKKALPLLEDRFLLLNGDTLFLVNVKEMDTVFNRTEADVVLALKQMKKADRYGVVEADATGRVVRFREKGVCNAGLINGGVYLVRSEWLKKVLVLKGESFSWEQDVLVPYVQSSRVYGFIADTYFIDMGIPEDFRRANDELPQMYRF